MISSYFKIAWRSLLNQKFYALLNVVGLSLGMTTCLTVILIIRDQYNYDNFHANGDRIYRINSQHTASLKGACAPYPLGTVLLNNYSVAEEQTRLVRNFYGVDATTATNMTLPMTGFFAEPSFFQMFNFRLETGDPATALTEPNTMVLSKKMSERFFGQSNPVGQTLVLKNRGGAYRITGVVAKPEGKTHLNFDCLASASSLAALESALAPKAPERVMDNWAEIYSTHVYIRLAPGKTKQTSTMPLLLWPSRRIKQPNRKNKYNFLLKILKK